MIPFCDEKNDISFHCKSTLLTGMWLFRKIQAREFAKVFLSGCVVGVCGGEFGFEFAKLDTTAIGANNGTPEVSFFIEGNAFVF